MSLVDNEDVQEGYLCPVCVKDLGSFKKLQDHFEQVHSNDNRDGFGQVKGFFENYLIILFKILLIYIMLKLICYN